MDLTNLTAIELEVLETIDRRPGRSTCAELVGELVQPVAIVRAALRQLRRQQLLLEHPAKGRAPAIYGITVFGLAELRRRHELKAVA